MGKKVGTTRMSSTPSASQNLISLRLAGSAKKPTQGVSKNAKSMLRHEHLQNLALWAGAEASIPSLAAFFGRKLAADEEALAITRDPSLFPCRRCETILQPGFNCTVRIEKNRAKSRRKQKRNGSLTQNNVVYKCHFCSHQNLKRGTPKGYIKELCPPKPKASSLPRTVKSVQNFNLQMDATKDGLTESDANDLKTEPSDISTDNPATPSVSGRRTLLDSKKRKKNKSVFKTLAEPENESKSGLVNAEKTVCGSSKKRRKSWTSLKEIVEGNEKSNGRSIASTTVPFLL